MNVNRLFLVGFMGCGKSCTGIRLAERIGWQFIDSDSYIEQKYSQTISQLFKERGEQAFRQIEQDALLELIKIDRVVIATGGGMPCYADNMEIMNTHGTTIFLQPTEEQLFKWLQPNKSKRPLLANKNDEELRAYIANTLVKRLPYYSQAQLTFNTNDEQPFEHINQIIKQLNLE